MHYQVTDMYQTGENWVCPKAAQACPNPRRLDICLLYTSDAADEGLGVDLGGRRII